MGPFTEIAHRYDRLNDLLSLGTHRLWKARLTDELLRLVPAPRIVLDVATGTGDLPVRFARRLGPEARLLGLDPCAPMLERARGRGVRCDWVEGATEAIPLGDGAADLLTCAFGVRNFADRPRAFREWARVLRPGGIAGVVEIHPVPRVWYRAPLAAYWHGLVPLLGPAYGYLRDSSRRFVTAEALAEEIRGAGLIPLRVESLFASGMVSLGLFRKA